MIQNGAANNRVGGSLSGERNFISGNNDSGIWIAGEMSTGNVIRGNRIGINAGSIAALPNGTGIGIDGAPNTTIGGTLAGESNVISGNDHFGISLTNSQTTGTIVSGNLIGLNPTGSASIGNDEDGVRISLNASGNTIGPANVISGNGYSGVVLLAASGNTVIGNRIGTDVTGMGALPNGSNGILVHDSASNTIGGSTALDRNLISGNGGDGIALEGVPTTGNTIRGNYIGVNVVGGGPLGNDYSGIYLIGGANHNTIGGGGAGQGNLISANSDGILINGIGCDYNIILGNTIGMAAGGSAAMGNTGNGIRITSGSQYNQIGGDSPAEGNLISGNDTNGIYIEGADHNTISANRIGVDTTGNLDRGNGNSGIAIYSGASNNRIGGSLAGERNIISGNQIDGIYLNGSSDNVIVGNYIGVNQAGTAAVPNMNVGIDLAGISQDNQIGGPHPSEANLISGNGSSGIALFGGGASCNMFENNRIGVSAASNRSLSNGGSGIEFNLAHDNLVLGGIIAHNLGDGVRAVHIETIRNLIQEVRIFDNTSEGILLIDGANDSIPAPVINTAVIESGQVVISGAACPGCTVELFASSSDAGQGELFLGKAAAGGAGEFSFSTLYLPLPFLTSTATDLTRGTSAFSSPLASDFGMMILPLILRP